jgi:hypothetical protein
MAWLMKECFNSLGLKGSKFSRRITNCEKFILPEYTGGKLHIPTILQNQLIKEAKAKGLQVLRCSFASFSVDR